MMNRKIASLAALLAAGPLVAGCAQEQAGYGGGYQPGLTRPGLGTLGGAAAGAAAGRVIAGENDNLATILGGAAVGALAGNVLADNAIRSSQQRSAAAEADAANQRQLDYERQRQLQQAETDREIRERAEFEEWRRTRGASPAAGPVNTYADVVQAQRYLIALGYLSGTADGVIGPRTRTALTRFQSDRGLSPTGTVTPDVLAQLRTALG